MAKPHGNTMLVKTFISEADQGHQLEPHWDGDDESLATRLQNIFSKLMGLGLALQT